MSIGQPLRLRVDTYPDPIFRGRVVSQAPATGNFNTIVQRMPVRIAVTGSRDRIGLLRPGLSVEATVDTHHQDGRPS